MAQVLVRNLPDDVVARLKARAANENKSLEQLLRDILEREAVLPKALLLEELRKLRESMPVVDFDIAEMIREGREERDQAILGALNDEP
jgi:plasmid stability protein